MFTPTDTSVDETQSINRAPVELSLPFTRMADRLNHNADDPFGGCFVIIPPRDGGDAIETLILDGQQDPAQFWIMLKTKCDMQIARLDERSRAGQAFGLQRR